ncbi:MAG: hypothetical protein OEW15_02240 [Nitrospirota bacterium]|nr:hypothetical protein [Nitrospirota bacterium]
MIMEVIRFVVNETPFAFWDMELVKKNLEFLEGFEPDYFDYIVRTQSDHLEGADKQKAALSLRLAYYHGLETLFALLCSAVQAPQCSLGWILCYRNNDLVDLVRKISLDKSIYTRMKDRPVTWEYLAKLVHTYLKYDEEKKEWIQSGFGRLWRHFASDFVNADMILEYNGLKHGFRVRPGGFHLAFGIEDKPGVPAAPEKMELIGSSLYGSSYFVPDRIDPSDKYNFRPSRHAHNWNPVNLANGLLLISASINNVISWLRMINGISGDKCRFENPETSETFELPWKETVGVSHVKMDIIIERGQVRPISKKEIIKTYLEDNIDQS